MITTENPVFRAGVANNTDYFEVLRDSAIESLATAHHVSLHRFDGPGDDAEEVDAISTEAISGNRLVILSASAGTVRLNVDATWMAAAAYYFEIRVWTSATEYETCPHNGRRQMVIE